MLRLWGENVMRRALKKEHGDECGWSTEIGWGREGDASWENQGHVKRVLLQLNKLSGLK